MRTYAAVTYQIITFSCKFQYVRAWYNDYNRVFTIPYHFFHTVSSTIIWNKNLSKTMKISNWRLLSFIAFAVLAAAGCASSAHIEKDPSVNFASYRTFTWMLKPDSLKAKSRANDLLEKNMKMAVTRELEKVGLRENKTRPDVLMDYDVLVERAARNRSESVYSQPYYRPFFNPYTRRWGSIYYPSQYLGQENYSEPVNEGTITITMIDANTERTIWQGWTTDVVNSRYITAKEIETSVKQILKKYEQ